MKKALPWISAILVIALLWFFFRPESSPGIETIQPDTPLISKDFDKEKDEHPRRERPLHAVQKGSQEDKWRCRIHGKVVFADSERPVSGADVTLFLTNRMESPQPIHTITDTKGLFSLEVEKPGVYYAKARKDNFGNNVYRYSDVLEQNGELTIKPDMRDLGPITLWVEKLKTLDVYVTDQLTGEPIKEALVEAIYSGADPSLTDESGHTLVHMPPTRTTITVWAPGYAYQSQWVDFSAEPIKTLHIQLQPGGLIYGSVKDINDQPLSDVIIYLSQVTGGSSPPHIFSDKEGYYEYHHTPLDTSFSLSAKLDNYVAYRIKGLKIDPAQASLEWNIKLKPTELEPKDGQYLFKLQDDNGDPLIRARTKAFIHRKGKAKVEELGDGLYLIHKVGVDQFLFIAARVKGFITFDKRVKGQPLNAPPEVFTLERGYQVSGKVTDKQGNPIADAKISAKGEASGNTRGARSRSDGSFTIKDIDAGVTSIGASHPDYSGAKIQVTAPIEDVSIILPPPSGLHITVVDQETSQPVIEFEARLRMEDWSYKTQMKDLAKWRFFDTPDGRFSIEPLRADYTAILSVRADGYVDKKTHVRIGDEPTEILVELKPGNIRLQGVLVDPQGNAWSDVSVTLGFEADHMNQSLLWDHLIKNQYVSQSGLPTVITGPDGSFEFPLSLETGINLGVTGGGVSTQIWKRIEQSFDIRKPIRLTVQAGAAIRGICNLEKWPMARQIKFVSEHPVRWAHTAVMEDGSFIMEGLPTGTWFVSWQEVDPGRMRGKERDALTIHIAAGELREVRLGFDQKASIEGTVYFDGIPAPGAYVYLLGEGKGGDPVRIIHQENADQNANVKFTDLRTGTYMLTGFQKSGSGRVPSHPNRITIELNEESWRGRLDYRIYTHVFGRFIGEGAQSLRLSKTDQDFFENFWHASELNDGNFHFWDTAPGTYTLKARSRSGERSFPNPITVVEGQKELDLGDISLDPAGSIRVGFYNQPNENYHVSITGPHIQGSIGASGNHSENHTLIKEVPAGPITVFAVSSREHFWVTDEVNLELLAGEERDVMLTIRDACALVFSNPSPGDPFRSFIMTGPGETVQAVAGPVNMPGKAWLSSLYGTVRDIPPGDWTLEVEHQSGRTQTKTVTLQLGKRVTVILD